MGIRQLYHYAFCLSHALFGAPVWGHILGTDPELPRQYRSLPARMEVSHREQLRWIIRAPKELRISLLYLFANQIPLKGLAWKTMVRYYSPLPIQYRWISDFVQAARQTSDANQTIHHGSAGWAALANRYNLSEVNNPGVTWIYDTFRPAIREDILSSSRLQARGWAQPIAGLVEHIFAAAPTSAPQAFTQAMYTAIPRRELTRSSVLPNLHGDKPVIGHIPSWHLPAGTKGLRFLLATFTNDWNGQPLALPTPFDESTCPLCSQQIQPQDWRHALTC